MTPSTLIHELQSEAHYIELSTCLDDLSRLSRRSISPEDQIKWSYLRSLEEVRRALAHPGVKAAMDWLLHEDRLKSLIQAASAEGLTSTPERIRLVTSLIADAIRRNCYGSV